jgi:hypothetical protein
MRARRRAVVDEYVEDGRAAIYSADGVVVLLSELATRAWQTVGEDWVEVSEVSLELVREFGPPVDADADALTAEALRALADMHVVELDEATSP